MKQQVARLRSIQGNIFKELVPDTKKPIGLPKKVWDPVVDWMRIVKVSGSIDNEKDAKEMIDAMSNGTLKVIFSNRKEFEFLVKHRKKLLMEMLMEGLSKNNVVNILMSKEPTPVHTSSMKKMGMDSKTNKPINPIIIAKRTRINKKA